MPIMNNRRDRAGQINGMWKKALQTTFSDSEAPLLDFVLVSNRLPEDGQEVEVIRDVYYHGASGYMRYSIERTVYTEDGLFMCDMVSTGQVVAWRPAEPWSDPSSESYAKLMKVFTAED